MKTGRRCHVRLFFSIDDTVAFISPFRSPDTVIRL
jgi:hypothetical protein